MLKLVSDGAKMNGKENEVKKQVMKRKNVPNKCSVEAHIYAAT
jgi:hypothetical protein